MEAKLKPIFFFQAEDGIRDSSVTGVQTCALPDLLGSGWTPHEPSEIIKLRYGDCKDHATLMGALLAAKGIASEAVVVNAGNVYTLPQVAVRGYRSEERRVGQGGGGRWWVGGERED